MAAGFDDGRTWGRPESLDTLGRLPGRGRRSLGTVAGVVAIALGAWIGFTGAAAGTAPSTTVTALPTPQAPTALLTCATIGATFGSTRIPAEGVAPGSVVRLLRTAPDGTTSVLVPQAVVVWVTPVEQGFHMSISVRTDAGTVEQLSAAGQDSSLTVAVLYDVAALDALNECRRAP